MSAIYKDGTLYPTGGSGSSGHTILDNTGTSLTDEPNLKFGGDFEVSDDSENDETEVTPHRLTSDELANICSPLPASTANLPVLFDESGAEYVVGWYKRSSDGKKKPVYEKDLTGLNIRTTWNSQYNTIVTITELIADVEKFVNIFGYGTHIKDSNAVVGIGCIDIIKKTTNTDWTIHTQETDYLITALKIQFTKTTDSWND